MAKHRYTRFFSRKSIVSLIGIDYKVLEQSEHDNWAKFYLAGSLVVGILIISFTSVFYAFDLMFNMWHAEILLSSFFALMFFTIYIFLIQTFSKIVFPTAKRFKFFNLSNLSRIGFVLMIGFLIAQPVKIFIFRTQLNNDLDKYKTQLYQKFCIVNAGLYASDLNKLIQTKNRYQFMPKSQTIDQEIAQIDLKINKINDQVLETNDDANHRISGANFFIKRVELANKYAGAWLIVFLIIGLFFTPIALIYSISGTSRYYALKKKYDNNLVLIEYSNFKIKYSSVFEQKYELKNIQYDERFLDPPFNSVLKPLPDYLTQEDFFDNLFSNGRL